MPKAEIMEISEEIELVLSGRVDFVAAWNKQAIEIHRTAKEKGWWDEDRNDGEILALIHSEVSEALEALRQGNPSDKKLPQFKNVEVELADVVIRIMDYAMARHYRVAEAIEAKADYNKSRPHKHGKNF